MALNYNGVSPTTINYNGTSLTVLKYGTTAVWGKPYSLSISAGSNTSVTVNRTSSPNQHASTGVLSSGSVIYYGDTLTVSYSVSSGYNIDTHTVNGTTFTSGQSFTVTGGISVITTAVASASWHTVWTGTVRKSWNVSSSIQTQYVTNSAFNSVDRNKPLRITFSFDWYEEYSSWSSNRLTFTITSTGNRYISQNKLNTSGTASDLSSTPSYGSYCFIGLYDWYSGSIDFQTRTAYTQSDYYSISELQITKVEQYY